MIKLVTTFIAAVLLTFGVSACAAPEPVVLSEETIIIDVRTEAEFQSGHLEGALNLDVNSGALAQSLSQLDPSKSYLVYCKSGNRAGNAIKLMNNAGLLSTQNLGSLSNAEKATGLEIVRSE